MLYEEGKLELPEKAKMALDVLADLGRLHCLVVEYLCAQLTMQDAKIKLLYRANANSIVGLPGQLETNGMPTSVHCLRKLPLQ